MTEARAWPNVAKEARDRAAEEAIRGMRALRPLVEGAQLFDRTEILRRQSVALDALNTIAFHMASVGAPTRPQ
jgi:hypothetical protein